MKEEKIDVGDKLIDEVQYNKKSKGGYSMYDVQSWTKVVVTVNPQHYCPRL